MDWTLVKNVLCRKCFHPVREHQPAHSAPANHGGQRTVGCSMCACQLSMIEKMRMWGGE